MCKYINFNNLKKKKEFMGGGVVVGGLHLCENIKNNQENTKKKGKTQKTIYYLNSKKTMKTSFYCSQKSSF